MEGTNIQEEIDNIQEEIEHVKVLITNLSHKDNKKMARELLETLEKRKASMAQIDSSLNEMDDKKNVISIKEAEVVNE